MSDTLDLAAEGPGEPPSALARERVAPGRMERPGLVPILEVGAVEADMGLGV